VNTEQIFSALQTELITFTERRTPAYLKAVMSAGCYVYGAGSYGGRMLALLRTQNIPCFGIIDRKFISATETINGAPALAPDALTSEQAAGKCLLIGVHNHIVNMAEIIAYGRKLGFAEVLLRYRVTGDMAAHPHSEFMQQYAPPGLLQFSGPITFVDGGAYDGDTYKHLQDKGIAISTWLAFEPDPINYQALVSFARELPIQSVLFPCGLSESFMQVEFAANEGTSSHLSTGGGSMTVPCVALDDVIHGPMPDYIKLDIEGAEGLALRGMRNTITSSQPHLAISAYHRPEDLWVLPQLLGELAPYADLYLRQHSRNAFETVLYAVPRGSA